MKFGYIILQIIVFGVSFFSFGAMVKIFPWYEQDPIGYAMILYVFTIVQVIISILFLLDYVNIVSHINSAVLVLAMYFAVKEPDLFFNSAFTFTIAECLLAVTFVVIEIRNFIKKGSNSQEF